MQGMNFVQIQTEYGGIVGKLIYIYMAWSKALPKNAHAEASYAPPQFLSGKSERGSSLGTVPQRIVSVRRRKQEAVRQIGSLSKKKGGVAEDEEEAEDFEEDMYQD